MKCNYYSYWMTNFPKIFGDEALICCCSCSCRCCLICMHCLVLRQNRQSLLSVCQKCKVKVANKRGNLDTIPALLLREKEIDFHFNSALNVKCNRYLAKRRAGEKNGNRERE